MKSKYIPYLIITYIISRVVLYGLGVRFDGSSDTHIMQLPPFELLETSPIETLWYMHMQPPIYAVLFLLFGQSPLVFNVFYFVLGGGVIIGLYTLIIGFGVHNMIAFVVSIMFMLSPSFILFNNLMFYTFFVMSLLVFSALALQRNKIFIFSILLMMLCFTRSIFHPVWMGVSLWIACSKRFG